MRAREAGVEHRYYKLHGYETMVVSGVLADPLVASDVAEVYSNSIRLFQIKMATQRESLVVPALRALFERVLTNL